MANRNDSGSSSAHQNETPTSHNEDAIPEMTEEVRGQADDDFEEVDDTEADDEADEDAEEGTF